MTHDFAALFDSLTVGENVAFPLRERAERGLKMDEDQILARVAELLDHVELGDSSELMPSDLSTGMKRAVAIARALANDPPILVADEPTGSLDSVTADHIFDVFEHLVQERGKTIVMVTHDNSLAPRFTRHVQIVDGEVLDLTGSGRKSRAGRKK